MGAVAIIPAPDPLEITGSAAGQLTGSTTGAVAIIPALSLADWMQPVGTENIALALLRKSDATNIYADSNRGGSDAPIDGELGLGPDETLITRVRLVTAGFVLNDDDVPAALSLMDYFGTGDAAQATIYFQSPGGIESVSVAGNIDGSSPGFVRLIIPAAFRTLVADVPIGGLFILGITSLIPFALSGTITGALSGAAVGTLAIVPVADPLDLTGSVDGSLSGSVTGVVSIVPVGAALAISGTITGGLSGTTTGAVVIVPVGAPLDHIRHDHRGIIWRCRGRRRPQHSHRPCGHNRRRVRRFCYRQAGHRSCP